MSWSMRLLTVSRPLTLVACMIVFIVDPRLTPASLALYVLSTAYFIVSSAIVNEWVPTTYAWRFWAQWSEFVLITYLNWHGIVHYSNNAMMAGYMVATVSIPLSMKREHWRLALSTVLTGWLLTSIVGMRITAGTWAEAIPTTLIFGGAMLFFASTGVLVVNLQDEKARSERLLNEVTESRAALDRAHRQLQESAATQQQLAVLEERQRLAREIHDSVAHGLTALVVQTQVAGKLLTRDPERAAETVGRCEEMAREALQETRRAVRALHPAGLEQVTDADALQRLARDFAIATGIDVQVEADDAVRALPADPSRLEHLYRIFQEALTNAQRHAQATAVRAVLSATSSDLKLEISNNGTPPTHLEPGIGLKSMAERARSLGGSIDFVAGPVGLTIHVTVPIQKERAG